uniref:AlNc14C292G10252 protein n=1 Tax=Albugo laibachii Nc14 TaxID=890382 RepID=F0WVA7_9STRA|nr:AlNc14C292G10252 [Albugo laibachii Nc14]|eukprot:CCA25346.1 AlNc14C292G10252 [Albugo laibachii Nc14]
MDRIQTRYGADTPTHDTLLAELFPTPDDWSTAQALALFDLYLRSYAVSIHMDPLKIATLAEIQSPERILHSHFLLWDDMTLIALASSSFGGKLIVNTAPNISDAVGILADVADTNEDMEDAGSASYYSDSSTNSQAAPCR